MEEQPEIIKGRILSDTEKSWFDYLTKIEQETPQRLEEVAKFLTGLVAIVFSIFMNLGDKAKEMPAYQLVILVFPWLFALLFAIIAIFPFPYKLPNRTFDDIKNVQATIIKQKYYLLVASAICFIIAVFFTAYFYFSI